MRPGREMDCSIAEEVFGRRVFVKARVLYEEHENGARPLPEYTKRIDFAWEVAEKMSVSLLPVENGAWFAMVGPELGWRSPADFIQNIQSGNFVDSGAAVGPSAPMMICVAALKAVETRKAQRQIDEVSFSERLRAEELARAGMVLPSGGPLQ